MKVAIITGGNRGGGKSSALHLARRGVGIILTYRSHVEEAEVTVSEIQASGGPAVALQLDVSKVSTFDSFLTEVLRILRQVWERDTFDYLVNNAGIAQRLIPHMASFGHIINISTAMTRVASSGTAAYASAKGVIEVFTRYIAREFMDRKIRCNTIAPGVLETDFGGGRTDDFRQRMGALSVAGRIAPADDIRPVVASLLPNDLEWIDGQRIEVTGSPY